MTHVKIPEVLERSGYLDALREHEVWKRGYEPGIPTMFMSLRTIRKAGSYDSAL